MCPTCIHACPEGAPHMYILPRRGNNLTKWNRANGCPIGYPYGCPIGVPIMCMWVPYRVSTYGHPIGMPIEAHEVWPMGAHGATRKRKYAA